MKYYVAFIIFLLVFACQQQPEQKAYTPEEPIEFSHSTHAGDLEIDCQTCHTLEDGNSLIASSCATCHPSDSAKYRIGK
jgi:hypothetical protein